MSSSPLSPLSSVVPVSVRLVSAPSSEFEEFASLRTRVLRPVGAPLLRFPGDEDATTAHVAAFEVESKRMVGVSTARPAAAPEAVPTELRAEGTEAAWQLRGMATEGERRGGGVGKAVINALADHVRAQGGRLLWCNARLIAVPFYEKNGFVKFGEQFDIPEVGPHFVMARVISTEDVAASPAP